MYTGTDVKTLCGLENPDVIWAAHETQDVWDMVETQGINATIEIGNVTHDITTKAGIRPCMGISGNFPRRMACNGNYGGVSCMWQSKYLCCQQSTILHWMEFQQPKRITGLYE